MIDDVQERAGRCPECGHPATKSGQWLNALRVRLGRAPRPAECRESRDDIGGFSAPCGCTDAFHGS